MKCPFCKNECQELTNQWGRPIFVCQQDDHLYECTFDYMDGETHMLKIEDKIYYGDSINEL